MIITLIHKESCLNEINLEILYNNICTTLQITIINQFKLIKSNSNVA